MDVAPHRLRLWYRRPADTWLAALPVGCGRLGAMVGGGVPVERLQLNEETLRRGGPIDRTHDDARPALAEVRKLIAEGRYEDADRLAAAKLLGRPPRLDPYQPLGDLTLSFDHDGEPTDYVRDLDLLRGVAGVRYRAAGASFRREVFASAVDNVLVVRLSVDEPGALSFAVDLKRAEAAETTILGADGLRLVGALDSVRFEARLRVLTDGGSLRATGDRLVCADADGATLVLAARSDYRGGDPAGDCARDLRLAERAFESLLADHEADHRRLFGGFDLDLGGAERAAVPTDERLEAVRAGDDDPDLIALYAQYGRYLLLGSSRPGTLPAYLQGIWCEDFTPPWNCNYTININLQMNYQPADVVGLGACVEPLIEFVESLREPGRRTADRMYGCRGFCAHHVTDIWGATTACDGPWGVWPFGAAWLCCTLGDHLAFAADPAADERVYPILREACEFVRDWLLPSTDGLRTSSPSTSPENRFRAGDGQVGRLTHGATMDLAIAWDLFSHTIACAERQGIDAQYRADLLWARELLAPPAVGRWGQLQEWAEDYDEPEPGHRHVSHLYGLFPGRQITRRGDPALAEAVRVSIDRRRAHGGFGTGWSNAWLIGLAARLGDGELAGGAILDLLRRLTAPNLFDLHPPRVFQIDGNLGATAGIAEMLLQSHAGEIELLPALPAAWPTGRATGLRARGGWTVDLAWRDGRLTEAFLTASREASCRVRYALPLAVEGTPAFVDGEVRSFRAAEGMRYRVHPV